MLSAGCHAFENTEMVHSSPLTEVGIYKRRQESKKTRKKEHDQESDQEKKKTRKKK